MTERLQMVLSRRPLAKRYKTNIATRFERVKGRAMPMKQYMTFARTWWELSTNSAN